MLPPISCGHLILVANPIFGRPVSASYDIFVCGDICMEFRLNSTDTFSAIFICYLGWDNLIGRLTGFINGIPLNKHSRNWDFWQQFLAIVYDVGQPARSALHLDHVSQNFHLFLPFISFFTFPPLFPYTLFPTLFPFTLFLAKPTLQISKAHPNIYYVCLGKASSDVLFRNIYVLRNTCVSNTFPGYSK